MTIKQLSVFLENKSGRINEVTKVLGENGINMHAFSMAETTDFGILRLMTDDNDFARTEFSVSLDGEDCGVNLMSRSVARGTSHQEFYSVIKGNNRCSGHSECDAILSGNGTVTAEPALEASHVDASLIHEAAIGKIAGEQILKLQTLGLTEKEAEEKIVEGFLR